MTSKADNKIEKLEKLKAFKRDGDLFLFETVLDLEQEIKLARDTLLRGFDNVSTLDLEKIRGEAGPMGLRGKAGKDGVSPDPQALVEDVLSRIPKPKNGKDGISPKAEDIIKDVLAQIPKQKKAKDGRDGSPDKPIDIRNKLESLRDDERLQMGAIDGLKDELAELREFQENLKDEKFRLTVFGGGGGSSDTVVSAGDGIYGGSGSLTSNTNVTMAGFSFNFVGATNTTTINSNGIITTIDGGQA